MLLSKAMSAFGGAASILAIAATFGVAEVAAVPSQIVSDVCPGACDGYPWQSWPQFASNSTKLFLVGRDPLHGEEVRVSNSSTLATELLRDIAPGTGGSNVAVLGMAGEVLFFSALTQPSGNWPATGYRVWRSEGTAATTTPVDFPVAADATSYSLLADSTSRGVFAHAFLGLWWIPPDGGAPHKLLDTSLRASVESKQAIYLVGGNCGACPGDQTAHLYRFEPPATLSKLGPLPPVLAGKFVSVALARQGVFILSAGQELWFSDGSFAPKLVHQWTPPARVSGGLVAMTDGTLVFGVDEDNLHGNLWTSDGTAAGTLRLTKFGADRYRFVLPLGSAGESFLFSVDSRPSPVSPYPDVPAYPDYAGLWVLDDAQPQGARPLRAIAQLEPTIGDPRRPFDFDGRMLFYQYQARPEQYWVSDGTAGGTNQLDVDGGPIAAVLGRQGDWAYFGINGAQTGREVHRVAMRDLVMPSVPTVDVVEYYNEGLDHYFVTADPEEKAKLDAGTTKGWARTGYGFVAYAPGTGSSRASPVCRFYGRPEAKLDSHFYSASPSECAEVEAKFGAAWQKESANVFEVELPDSRTGACRPSTSPLFRAFNGRVDANHRYSVHANDQKAMQNAGWIPEGVTTGGIVMCVLAGIRP